MNLTQEEVNAYLKRIGIADIEPPTYSYLTRLHQAHVANVPWETIDIYAGKPTPIDVRESVKLIANGRSGYCFHLNGAFSTLLRSLGYRVNWHRAGVQPLGQEPRVNSFHLGLTVLLPDASNGGEDSYIIDVGLGDMPYEPLPLRPGVYKQGPLVYEVANSAVVEGGWRLIHDSKASFVGVDFDPGVVTDIAPFKPKHDHYSRSAESPWIDIFLVRQRHAEGSNELRGCVWSKRESDGVHKITLESKPQWLEVLSDVFGERLVSYSNDKRDELWRRVRVQHEEWKRTNDNGR